MSGTEPSKAAVATIVIFPEEGKAHTPYSALAAYSHSLLGALPEAFRNRHVILTNLKTGAPKTYRLRGLTVVECWRKYSLFYWIQILRELRKHPDVRVVHMQHEFNQFGGLFTVAFIPVLLASLRWFAGKRIVMTLHEVLARELFTKEFTERICLPLPPNLARIAIQAYYRLICALAHHLTVQHPHFEQVLRTEYGIRKPVSLVSIGIESAPISPEVRTAARAELGIRPDEKCLVFFGVLDWRKGLDLLLDGFAALKGDGWRLIVAGGESHRVKDEPNYKEWLAKILARAQADPRIRTTGYVPDERVHLYFAAADLLILPYLVPQRVSAVMNQAIGQLVPMIACETMKTDLPAASQFAGEPAALAAAVEAAFAANQS